jgi:hypothetical protein
MMLKNRELPIFSKKDSFKKNVCICGFSFDTTGSMYACLNEVRRGVKEAIRRLKRDIPGRRNLEGQSYETDMVRK